MPTRPQNNVALKLKGGLLTLSAVMTGSGVVFARRPGAALATVVGMASCAAFTIVYAVLRRAIAEIRITAAALSDEVEHVSGAASQLSSAGESLAQSVTSQAESLAETSGTSDLMVSITRQSAESSRSAMDLMRHAEELAQQATRELEEMVRSIHEISSSASKISSITKVVDEIAFQTNILSLNAAVEAARAGESGAGFAVVADEVRNLARRSAEAARDIADLIEESLARTQDGTVKLDQVSGVMRALIDSTSEVKSVFDEVTISSEELARATEQISAGLARLEQLTAGTAADSRRSAATSRDMSTRTDSMRQLVCSLRTLAGESGNGIVRRTEWQRNSSTHAG